MPLELQDIARNACGDAQATDSQVDARIAYKPLYEAQAARVLALEDELRSLTREYDVWRERGAPPVPGTRNPARPGGVKV